MYFAVCLISLCGRKAVVGGMSAGAIGQFFASPTDLVKVQMQMEGKRKLEGKPLRSVLLQGSIYPPALLFGKVVRFLTHLVLQHSCGIRGSPIISDQICAYQGNSCLLRCRGRKLKD